MAPKSKDKSERVEVTPETAQKMMEDLDLNDEELDRFTNAFKDPKFMEMFVDYAKELADPKQREENDIYLRQLETEGKIEEIYGKGAVMIQPEKGFVVKTKKLTGGDKKDEKVFINVMYNEKIDEATSVKVKGGDNWNVPFSLSTLRKEKDNKGEEAETHDFVVNTKFYNKAMTHSSQIMRNFMIDLALENVEKMRYEAKVTLDKKGYSLPKCAYKGPETPPIQATKCSKDPNAYKENMGTTPKRMAPHGNPTKKSYFGVDDPKEKEGGAEAKGENSAPANGGGGAAVGAEEKGDTGGGRSEFKFDLTKRKKKEAPEVGLVEPKHEIVHSRTGDIQQAWSDNKIDTSAPSRPQSLLVKIALPRLENMRGVDLDVSKTRVLLTKPEMYRLDLPLPYEVDDSKGKAKFDKTRRVLEVTLPVIAAPVIAKAMPAAPEAEPLVQEIEPATSAEEAAEEEHSDVREADAADDEAPAEPATSAKGEEEEASTDDMTENQRKWAEMMALHDEKRMQTEAAEVLKEREAAVAHAQAIAAAPVPEASHLPELFEEEFYESSAFYGPRLGYVFKTDKQGLGYYRDVLEENKYSKELAHQAVSAAVRETITQSHKPGSDSAWSDGSVAGTPDQGSEPTPPAPTPGTSEEEKPPSQPDTTRLQPRLFTESVLELD